MPTPIEGWVQNVAMFMLCAALFLGFIRLYLGPSLPDRVLALDLITMTGVGLIALYAIATDRSILLDVAIALGLIAFLATVAFATFLERSTFARRRRRGRP
jgi:multicomponent Na+:H+ antiporter subunit F